VAAIKKDDPKCATDSDFGCQPPDGFYIRNTDKTIVQYQIDPAVSVTMQTLDKDSAGQYKFEDKITLARLVSAYAHKDDTMIHLAGVPYLLNISKGKITRIVEQYVP